MPLFKLTDIFQWSSKPDANSPEPTKTAGWSESVWTDQTLAAIDNPWTNLTLARVKFMSSQGKAIGFRTQAYTISGNKLIAGGSGSGAQNVQSGIQSAGEAPWVAAFFKAGNSTVTGHTRIRCPGLPASLMSGGAILEGIPAAGGAPIWNDFINVLKSGVFGWVGRDLTQLPVRVLAYDGHGLLTVSSLPANLQANQSFIRFFRCYDDEGLPVKGSYLVTNIGVPGAGGVVTLTLQNGPTGVVVNPSGQVRLDALKYNPFDTVVLQQAAKRSVGGPIFKYRGRRSKMRK